MLFVVRNSFSLYVLSMDASIYANEIFTEFVTTETELFSVLCVFPINIIMYSASKNTVLLAEYFISILHRLWRGQGPL